MYKHLRGKHNQASHGRSGAAREAGRAAFTQARESGGSIREARQARRDAGRQAQAGGGGGAPDSPAAAPAQAPRAFEPQEHATGAAADKHFRKTSPIQAADLSSAETAAMQTYQHNGYKDINDGLRTRDRRMKENKNEIDRIDAVMDRSRTTEDIRSYRGLLARPGTPGGALLDSLEVGGTYREPGYMSTTVDRRRMNSFLNSIGRQKGDQIVEIEIQVPAGTRAVYMNGPVKPRSPMQDYREERELLIARDAQYRVITKETIGNRTRVVMELIP